MNLNIQFDNKDHNNNILQFFGVFLLSIYPITFFFGTAVLNACVVLLDIIFIIEIVRKRHFKFLHCLPFYSLIFLWVILLINLFFFSIDFNNSLSRSTGFIRFIFFAFAIIYFLNIYNKKFKQIILGSWTIIFLITSLDLIYEINFGKNIFGFSSYMPGRLAGFFNDELIMGHYYYGFALIILSFLYQLIQNENFTSIKILYLKFNGKNFIYFFIFLFLIISMLIGERANFIRCFVMVLIFTLLLNQNHTKRKMLLIFSVITIFFLLIFNNQQYKVRFVTQLLMPFVNNPINYISSSSYWDHYSAGINVFKENKSFGVGLKNYRVYVKDKGYKNPSYHPHQSHIEILSELGLVGYFVFLFFFIINIKDSVKFKDLYNNKFKLSGLLFILTSFIPLLPTGSFFTSHAAALFWMNFAFLFCSKDNFK